VHFATGSKKLVRVVGKTAVPILPVGFYQYTITTPSDVVLPAKEAVHGHSLVSPYASTAAPQSAWFANMTKFMDRCAEVGFMVHFQLVRSLPFSTVNHTPSYTIIHHTPSLCLQNAFQRLGNDPATLSNITHQINKFKDHPALFGWYLADEPDGQGIAPSLLQPKYDLIKKLDPHHPVSMVFCAGGAARYAAGLDLIMVDPYPVPNRDAASVASTLAKVRAVGKPIMLVAQAFGGGEGWARAPSAREERLMSYLGLLYDCVAIQYFIRSAPISFPYAASAWGEIRKVAAEVLAIQSALAGGVRIKSVSASEKLITAGAWIDRDGSIVVVVANTGCNGAAAASVFFNVTVPGCAAMTEAVSIFEEGSAIPFEHASCTLSDRLRGMETRVYRIQRTLEQVYKISNASNNGTTDVAAARANLVYNPPHNLVYNPPHNLVYNPSYELSINPAVPDGNYVGRHTTCVADEAATFFADTRFSVEGRQSLRLSTPTANNGLELAPYRLPTLAASAKYNFSVWIRGAVGGEAVAFSFNTAVFAAPPAMPGGLLTLNATTTWRQHSVILTTTATPKIASYIPWMTYTLATAGSVWLDVLSVTKPAAPPPPCPPPSPTNRTYVGQISDYDGYCKNCTLKVVVSNCTSYWSWVWDYDGAGTKHVPVSIECGWYEEGGVITAPSHEEKPFYWFRGTQHQLRALTSATTGSTPTVMTGSLLQPSGVTEGGWALHSLPSSTGTIA
jgi:hypothetical protein